MFFRRRPRVVYLVEIRADNTTPPNYAYLPHVYDNLDHAQVDVDTLAAREWGADTVSWDERDGVTYGYATEEDPRVWELFRLTPLRVKPKSPRRIAKWAREPGVLSGIRGGIDVALPTRHDEDKR